MRRSPILSNVTIIDPGEILAALTSLQGDNVVNKFCVSSVFRDFSFVFQICLSKWRTGINAKWKKGMACASYFVFIFTLLHPFFALTIYIDRPLPQNYITWDLLPAGISLVSTNRRHYQEKKSKIHLSDTNFCFSSLPPNPWFWQWLCSLYMCPLLLGSPSPTATAVTGFWYSQFLLFSHQTLMQ